MRELMRYAPELSHTSDEEIDRFVSCQRRSYVDGDLPVIGIPIACLNPSFIDSTDDIRMAVSGKEVYTRASVKENGFRMQLHIGADEVFAFTRQFTRYDLRMFPELEQVFKSLPVMIGDAELVNKHHTHLAGFHRVKKRIPTNHWPIEGQLCLDDEIIMNYLSTHALFADDKPIPDLELTLAFHGLFAASAPETWGQSRHEQLASLESLCLLPVN